LLWLAILFLLAMVIAQGIELRTLRRDVDIYKHEEEAEVLEEIGVKDIRPEDVSHTFTIPRLSNTQVICTKVGFIVFANTTEDLVMHDRFFASLWPVGGEQ